MNMKAIGDQLPSTDQILRALGLETRRTAVDMLLPALGCFGAGLVVGAGLALVMAPKSGRDLREDLGERVKSMRAKSSKDHESSAPSTTATGTRYGSTS